MEIVKDCYPTLQPLPQIYPSLPFEYLAQFPVALDTAVAIPMSNAAAQGSVDG